MFTINYMLEILNEQYLSALQNRNWIEASSLQKRLKALRKL